MMGLIDGVGGLLGLSGSKDKEKHSDLEEMNLMDAINAHVTCKVHLQNILDGKEKIQIDPVMVGYDHNCVLGKWIHGAAHRQFQMSPSFYQLRAQHAQMHVIAGNVIKHVQANDRASAEALMQSTYKEASRKVVKALTELSQIAKE